MLFVGSFFEHRKRHKFEITSTRTSMKIVDLSFEQGISHDIEAIVVLENTDILKKLSTFFTYNLKTI